MKKNERDIKGTCLQTYLTREYEIKLADNVVKFKLVSAPSILIDEYQSDMDSTFIQSEDAFNALKLVNSGEEVSEESAYLIAKANSEITKGLKLQKYKLIKICMTENLFNKAELTINGDNKIDNVDSILKLLSTDDINNLYNIAQELCFGVKGLDDKVK